MHLLVQPLGIGAVFYKSNPWPIRGEGKPRSEKPICLGNLLVGLHF